MTTHTRLRNKLLIVIIGISVLSVVATSVLDYLGSRRALRQAALSHEKTVSLAIKGKLENKLTDLENSLRIIAGYYHAHQTSGPGDLAEMLAEGVNFLPAVTGLVISDPQGKIIAASDDLTAAIAKSHSLPYVIQPDKITLDGSLLWKGTGERLYLLHEPIALDSNASVITPAGVCVF